MKINFFEGFEVLPLTTKQKQAKKSVKEAYDGFWNDIKFRRGWEQPVFSHEYVDRLLDEAAEIVVRIRSHLDAQDPTFKLRMTDGSAREYLWTLQHGDSEKDDPMKDPKHFVREMVHYNFQDANGYVEGLNEEIIDKYIEIIRSQMENGNLRLNTIEKIQETWKQTQTLMVQLLELPTLESESVSTEPILKELQKLNLELSTLIQQSKANKDDDKEMKVDADSVMETESTSKETPANETQYEENRQQALESKETSGNEQKVQDESSQSSQMDSIPTSPAPVVEEPQSPTVPPAESSQSSQESNSEPQTPSTPTVEEVKSPQSSEGSTPSEEPKKSGRKSLKDSSIVKIQVVADDVDNLKPEIKLLHEAAEKLQYEELAKNPEGKKIIEDLQKKCVRYSESLMKDLLALDAIVASQESRPLRKAQVTNIQHMIDDVDGIQKKLRTLSESLKEISQPEENVPKAEEASPKQEKANEPEVKPPSPSPQSSPAPQAPSSPSKQEFRANWKQLKLKPKFEASETPRYYTIAAYVPGMDEKDIGISLGKNKKTITIEGVREPTKQEEEALRKQIRRRFNADMDPQVEFQMLLKAASGRFGKFSESYELPPDANPNDISATYEGGVLRVNIPKVVHQPKYAPRRGGHPNSFFNDRDLWW